MRIPSVPGPREVLALVDRGGETLERVLAAVPRIVPLLDRAEALLDEMELLLRRIEGTRRSAAAIFARADEPLTRLSLLVDAVEPPLLTLRPTLDRLAARTSPDDVEAAARLLDQLPSVVERLPQVMDQLETEVVPTLDAIRTVGPDMHDLLDASRQLNEMLGGVPGMGRIKKRMDEEQSEDE